MLVAGEGTALMGVSAREVLEFALDLDRYRTVDRKFRTIHLHEFQGDRGLVRYSGTLRGIPTPSDTQEIRLTRWTRLDYRSVPSALNHLARFHGWFECEERPEGTLVRHREEFDFPPLVGRAARAVLGKWLQSQVAREVEDLKLVLESNRTA